MTTTVLVYVVSLAAAALLATGSVVQQRVAADAPAALELRLGLIGWLLRRPLWLAGAVVGTAGQLLSVLALAFGSVALVQPLLVVQLLVALPIAARVDRVVIPARDWVGAALTAAGLALFLAVGRPTTGDSVEPSAATWLLTAGVTVGVAAVLAGVGRRLRGDRESTALAAAAGLVFALQAALASTAFVVLDRRGLGGALLSWLPYATAVAAVVGVVLLQSAYAAGSLLASYPVSTAVTPLASVAVGVLALDGRLAGDPLGVAAELVGLAVMTAGVRTLATSTLVTRR